MRSDDAAPSAGIGENWRKLLADGRISRADVDLLVRLSAEVDRSLELQTVDLDGEPVVVVHCDDDVEDLRALRAAYDPAALLKAKLYDAHYPERPDEKGLSPIGRIRRGWLELTPQEAWRGGKGKT